MLWPSLRAAYGFGPYSCTEAVMVVIGPVLPPELRRRSDLGFWRRRTNSVAASTALDTWILNAGTSSSGPAVESKFKNQARNCKLDVDLELMVWTGWSSTSCPFLLLAPCPGRPCLFLSRPHFLNRLTDVQFFNTNLHFLEQPKPLAWFLLGELNLERWPRMHTLGIHKAQFPPAGRARPRRQPAPGSDEAQSQNPIPTRSSCPSAPTTSTRIRRGTYSVSPTNTSTNATAAAAAAPLLLLLLLANFKSSPLAHAPPASACESVLRQTTQVLNAECVGSILAQPHASSPPFPAPELLLLLLLALSPGPGIGASTGAAPGAPAGAGPARPGQDEDCTGTSVPGVPGVPARVGSGQDETCIIFYGRELQVKLQANLEIVPFPLSQTRPDPACLSACGVLGASWNWSRHFGGSMWRPPCSLPTSGLGVAKREEKRGKKRGRETTRRGTERERRSTAEDLMHCKRDFRKDDSGAGACACQASLKTALVRWGLWRPHKLHLDFELKFNFEVKLHLQFMPLPLANPTTTRSGCLAAARRMYMSSVSRLPLSCLQPRR
ncbi:hypothetical protein GALMADRAFT_137574 [Galerina marginata CBS 339.88]|uniref:Uncharacterized protein n=1 Tax=Galerina marginata (strain CBS 339.88) TaxID=685588 RepID=A0A067T848_GALM3|nr:hypothetical protein GALMADRAFT_137574 [Galerina marginata CBS 339.88]